MDCFLKKFPNEIGEEETRFVNSGTILLISSFLLALGETSVDAEAFNKSSPPYPVGKISVSKNDSSLLVIFNFSTDEARLKTGKLPVMPSDDEENSLSGLAITENVSKTSLGKFMKAKRNLL